MDAWNKRTFSQQEEVMEKAKLEGLGVSEQEYNNFKNDEVQANLQYFDNWNIKGIQADAILFDIKNHYHKALFYTQPKGLDELAEARLKAGSQVDKKDGGILNIYVDMYQHKHRENEDQKPIMIWVGSRENIKKQVAE
ncbi:MAG: hypothetical protein GXP45_05350 [bacterium]|nr:hypothetical protein [bacterium]